MDYLVGYTGFVGSNLCESHTFDKMFHSTDIEEAFGGSPDLLVYSGVRAEMFLANQNPAADWADIENAIDNIRKIAPKRLVLISTVAVYPNPKGVDETEEIDAAALPAYGRNRYRLEQWVREHADCFPQGYLIVRLPALYGKNLKKNFIYDYIHVIPAMLTEAKLSELAETDAGIRRYYQRQDNGFYRCMAETPKEREWLKAYFNRAGFSALNFTDSRSVYQFYNLRCLWGHIETALAHSIPVLNLATEPISIGGLYRALTGREFVNELPKAYFDYDFRTKYAELFGGHNGYIRDKDLVLQEIRDFIRQETERQR